MTGRDYLYLIFSVKELERNASGSGRSRSKTWTRDGRRRIFLAAGAEAEPAGEDGVGPGAFGLVIRGQQ